MAATITFFCCCQQCSPKAKRCVLEFNVVLVSQAISVLELIHVDKRGWLRLVRFVIVVGFGSLFLPLIYLMRLSMLSPPSALLGTWWGLYGGVEWRQCPSSWEMITSHSLVKPYLQNPQESTIFFEGIDYRGNWYLPNAVVWCFEIYSHNVCSCVCTCPSRSGMSIWTHLHSRARSGTRASCALTIPGGRRQERILTMDDVEESAAGLPQRTCFADLNAECSRLLATLRKRKRWSQCTKEAKRATESAKEKSVVT